MFAFPQSYVERKVHMQAVAGEAQSTQLLPFGPSLPDPSEQTYSMLQR